MLGEDSGHGSVQGPGSWCPVHDVTGSGELGSTQGLGARPSWVSLCAHSLLCALTQHRASSLSPTPRAHQPGGHLVPCRAHPGQSRV